MSRTIFSQGIIIITCVIAGFNTAAKAQTTSPIFGDVTIQRPFSPDPLTVRGMSGGAVSADTIAAKKETPPTGLCKGFVDQDPDHTLKLTSKFDYLKLVVDSPADTTMIIKGPGGVWCNDDFDGKNPGIVGQWLSGTYQIWIGSYKEKEYLPYTLKITEVK